MCINRKKVNLEVITFVLKTIIPIILLIVGFCMTLHGCSMDGDYKTNSYTDMKGNTVLYLNDDFNSLSEGFLGLIMMATGIVSYLILVGNIKKNNANKDEIADKDKK